MLMDDAVVMATSKERLTEKLKYLQEYCDEYGMLVNENKTKFMAILGSDEDNLSSLFGQIPLKSVESLYMTGVKSLLGAKVTTTNLTRLLRAGTPSLQALVRQKQARFFNKIQQCNGMLVDTLWYVLQLQRKENQVMNSHIQR